MLTVLIRRELLDNLMTFRFAAAIVITLLPCCRQYSRAA